MTVIATLWRHVPFQGILIGLTLDYQLGIYANWTRNTGDGKCDESGVTSAFWKNVYTDTDIKSAIVIIVSHLLRPNSPTYTMS